MAISKDDTVLTYSKFKEFWAQFAVLFNKKLDGTGVANNDTTTDSGYVLDARVGKTHGDEIDKLNDQMNGIYLATNSAGKWGFKTSKNGAVTPFRQPTGNAVAANVLVGKTFANADSDSLTGTMPNNGSMTATLTPTGNNTTTKTIPAGYTSGGTITADGRAAYSAGYSAGTAAGKNSVKSAVSLGNLHYNYNSGSYTYTCNTVGYYIFIVNCLFGDGSSISCSSGASGSQIMSALSGSKEATENVYVVNVTSANATVTFNFIKTSAGNGGKFTVFGMRY